MSALCVKVDANGFVVSTITPVDQCTSYVLLDSSEWGVQQSGRFLQLLTLLLSGDSLFQCRWLCF